MNNINNANCRASQTQQKSLFKTAYNGNRLIGYNRFNHKNIKLCPMITKTIHYCWFGNNPIPEKDIAYMKTWQKFLPGYEIKRWDESNFNLDIFPYVRQAYDFKKYAFVSDVARLYALVHEGGIYMDTDVELLKHPQIEDYEAVVGFESKDRIMTAFMACSPNHPIFTELLNDYKSRQFIQEDGKQDCTTNVERLTEALLPRGLNLNDKLQTIDGLTILPSEYVCPYNNITHKITITDNTFCFHHFAGTWLEGKELWRHRMHEFLGPKTMQILTAIKRFVTGRKI